MKIEMKIIQWYQINGKCRFYFCRLELTPNEERKKEKQSDCAMCWPCKYHVREKKNADWHANKYPSNQMIADNEIGVVCGATKQWMNEYHTYFSLQLHSRLIRSWSPHLNQQTNNKNSQFEFHPHFVLRSRFSIIILFMALILAPSVWVWKRPIHYYYE